MTNTHWKPHPLHPCEGMEPKTVYIKGESVPFMGWMANPDSAFSCAAYIRLRGKRIPGYVGCQEGDSVQTFYAVSRD